MAHDVFISHSSKDKPAADAVCALLEADGIRCWIAPRDVQAGVSYAGAIIDAINSCRAMVLIFSDAANASPQIEREIERAANRRIPILPFRIENVAPERGLEYFLSTPHWLDAFTPPLEGHIRNLARQLHALLDSKATDPTEALAAAAAAVPLAAAAAAPAEAASIATAATPPAAQPKRRLGAGALVAIAAVVVGGALAVAAGVTWMGAKHAPAAPSAAPVAAAAPSSAEAAASSTSTASGAAPDSAAADSSAAAAQAVAATPPPPPPVAHPGGVRAGVGVGVRAPIVRPCPACNRPLMIRRPLPPPFRRRPLPPLRRRGI